MYAWLRPPTNSMTCDPPQIAEFGDPPTTDPTKNGQQSTYFTVIRISALFPRISGTYIACPMSGSAWKRPGTSARMS